MMTFLHKNRIIISKLTSPYKPRVLLKIHRNRPWVAGKTLWLLWLLFGCGYWSVGRGY